MAVDVFQFADDLGPAKIIQIYEPSIGLKAILVVDNVAKGPSIGGVRMALDVSLEECFRLARAMTLKNAAAGLPHGGGKSVVFGDPRMPKPDKERLIRGLAASLRQIEDYIFGPDMGTDEECMAWVHDEIARSVGLPREIGGIPLDEIGATGWGLSHAADVAVKFCDFELDGARVAVQGFGAVGKHAARFLAAKGAKLVAASDTGGTAVCADGFDIAALIALKESGQSVTTYPQAQCGDCDAIVDVQCDVWIPAARPDVINESNVARINTKLVLQGANIPITVGAERELSKRNILYVPDFIANAGGVICAAMEYHGASQSAALATIEEKVRTNTEQVLTRAKKDNIEPRQAAIEMGMERVRKAMTYRRFSLISMAPGAL